MLYSCNKLPETDYTFTPEENPEAGEIIYFENTTPEVSKFAWDFGDGNTSNQENPSHIFREAGKYEIKLTASNDEGEQTKKKNITINDPTILAFLIVDSSETIPLEGADLWIFDNEADWNNFSEPMLIGYADSSGMVEFSNLEAMVYYIWATRNEGDGIWISGGYTPVLTLNAVNAFYLPCVWHSYLDKKTTIKSSVKYLLPPQNQ
jgi:hypothetical protein